MSLEARRHIIDTYKFLPTVKTSDLLQTATSRPYLIDTDLVQCLLDLGPCLITSLCSDHSDDSALGPHGHSHGLAADVAPIEDNWLALLEKAAASKNIWTVGLGGENAASESVHVSWPSSPFILFTDNSQPHLHIQAANVYGQGLR